MSREIVFALRVGPAGTNSSELRKFGNSIVNAQKQVYHEVERLERQAFDRTAREHKRAADVAAREQRRSAAEAAKAQKEAADAAAREAKRAATEKIRFEKEAEREKKRIAKEAERDARAAAVAAVQEAKLSYSEQMKIARAADQDRRRIAREQLALNKEYERERLAGIKREEAAFHDKLMSEQNGSEARRRQYAQLTKAEEDVAKARQTSSLKLKSAFNEGTEGITSMVRGFALLGIASEETTAKMLEQFAKVEGMLQIIKGGVKTGFAVGDVLSIRGAAGGGARAVGGGTLAAAGLRSISGVGAASGSALTGAAASGAGGAAALTAPLGALTAALLSATAAAVIVRESFTGAAKKADSWTMWVAKGEVNFGRMLEKSTGLFSFLEKNVDNVLPGFSNMFGGDAIRDLVASDRMTERLEKRNAQTRLANERRDADSALVVGYRNSVRASDDRAAEQFISGRYRARLGAVDPESRNADPLLLKLAADRMAALSPFQMGRERGVDREAFMSQRQLAIQQRDRMLAGGLTETGAKRSETELAIRSNLAMQAKARGELRAAGNDPTLAEDATRRIIDLENRRIGLLKEMQNIERQTAADKLSSSDELLGKLRGQLDLTRQQRQAATERLGSARERFGMMDPEEQRRLIETKKKLDEADRLEKMGQNRHADRLRGSVSRNDISALRGMGLQGETSAAAREGERRGRDAGFDLYFGRGERAEIDQASRAEAMLKAKVNVESKFQIEVVQDNEALLNDMAARVNQIIATNNARDKEQLAEKIAQERRNAAQALVQQQVRGDVARGR